MAHPDKYKGLTEAELNARHKEKMASKKNARAKMLVTITKEKGLLIIHTGKGKGKTTAAMGLVARSLGHGNHVAVVQFVKGAWPTGEDNLLSAQSHCVFERMGEGFTWDTQDRARDIATAEKAWQRAVGHISSGKFQLVLLDELNIVLRYNYLDHNMVKDFLAKKPPELHLVITGRNAPDWLIEMADLVTSFEEVKHPFKSGIKAQKGIEY